MAQALSNLTNYIFGSVDPQSPTIELSLKNHDLPYLKHYHNPSTPNPEQLSQTATLIPVYSLAQCY